MNRRVKQSRSSTKQFAERLTEWHAKNRRSFPWRERPTPYRVFVAEVFLQRTPAGRVESHFENFVAKYPSPQALASADAERLQLESSQLGLKKRFEWLVGAANVMCEEHDGEVPGSPDGLLRLPGVGTYTAAAILSFAFGEDIPIVDVNVARVVARHFALGASKRSELYDEVESIVSMMVRPGGGPILNEALLDFGSLVCKLRPLCCHCPMKETCVWRQGNS